MRLILLNAVKNQLLGDKSAEYSQNILQVQPKSEMIWRSLLANSVFRRIYLKRSATAFFEQNKRSS